MNSIDLFYVLIFIVVIDFLFDKLLIYKSVKSWESDYTDDLKGIYDKSKYEKAKKYHQANTNLSVISSSISFSIFISLLLVDGFAFVDEYVSEFFSGIMQSLIFFAVLFFATDLLSLPFAWYDTFVIEQKYGFNKTTRKTFLLDKIKGYAMTITLGGIILAAIIWIFNNYSDHFWWISWIFISLIMVLMNMFYANLFLPLFNSLTPLKQGSLRDKIEGYSEKVGFEASKIFVIDGSKRSTKANAFFSGLGSKKTIALYDTLIEKLSEEEIVAVLAHEVGHYQKKHSLSSMAFAILQIGLMLFLLDLSVRSPLFSTALGVAEPKFHIGVLAFTMLYNPVSLVSGIITNGWSRRNEYQADQYAKETYDGQPLITALKKLTADNLSNLTPDKLNVFVGHSHPKLVDRIRALEKE